MNIVAFPFAKDPDRDLLALCCLGLTLLAAGCVHVSGPDTSVPVAAEPSPSEPVTAAMVSDHPTVRPGESFQLVVQVRIANGYHIYSTDRPHGPFSPSSLTLALPEELETLGNWVVPKPILTGTSGMGYRDSALFRLQLRVRLNALEKPLSIKGGFLCQACAQDLCFPARKIPISTSVAVALKTRK